MPFGVALLQIVVQRTLDFTNRIESFSVDKIDRRLPRSLIRSRNNSFSLSIRRYLA